MQLLIVVLVAVLAVIANGYVQSSSSRLSNLKMMADPWFPNAVTTNTVGIDALNAVFAKSQSSEQNFLEANPYWSTENIPLQLFKAKVSNFIHTCEFYHYLRRKNACICEDTMTSLYVIHHHMLFDTIEMHRNHFYFYNH